MRLDEVIWGFFFFKKIGLCSECGPQTSSISITWISSVGSSLWIPEGRGKEEGLCRAAGNPDAQLPECLVAFLWLSLWVSVYPEAGLSGSKSQPVWGYRRLLHQPDPCRASLARVPQDMDARLAHVPWTGVPGIQKTGFWEGQPRCGSTTTAARDAGQSVVPQALHSSKMARAKNIPPCPHVKSCFHHPGW